MKNAYENNIEILKLFFKNLSEYINIENDKEKLYYYLNYIIETEEIEEVKLEKLFVDNFKRGYNMPTLAQKWYQQGVKEGIEKGIKKGLEKGKNIGLMEDIEEGEIIKQQEILIKLLSKKFGLNNKEKELIKSIKDKDKLDQAIDAFVFAENKEEVLNQLKKI